MVRQAVEALPRAAVLEPMAEVLLDKMVRENSHIGTPGLRLRSVAMQEGFEHWIAGAPALLPLPPGAAIRTELKGPRALLSRLARMVAFARSSIGSCRDLGSAGPVWPEWTPFARSSCLPWCSKERCAAAVCILQLGLVKYPSALQTAPRMALLKFRKLRTVSPGSFLSTHSTPPHSSDDLPDSAIDARWPAVTPALVGAQG